jgi:hypothetical protein
MVVLMRLSTSDVGLRAIRGLVCADWDGSSEAIALVISWAIGRLAIAIFARALTTRLMEILANEIDIEFEITFFANILITII